MMLKKTIIKTCLTTYSKVKSDSDDSSDDVLQDEGTATQPDESEIAASSSG